MLRAIKTAAVPVRALAGSSAPLTSSPSAAEEWVRGRIADALR